MYPSKEEAIKELEEGGRLNPGNWVTHSYAAADAAKLVAEKCGLDPEKAYVLGLLHDIGRRAGVSKLRHIIDGYDYAMSKGWDDIARISLVHSYPVKDSTVIMETGDLTDKNKEFVTNYLNSIEYNDYDKLIILSDAITYGKGFCTIEKRFVDVILRYGNDKCVIDRLKKTFEYKEYFESKIGYSIYKLLPNIEKCIYE